MPQPEDVTKTKWKNLLNPKVIKKIFKIGQQIAGAYSQGGQGLNMNLIGNIARDGMDIINNDLGGLNLNDFGQLGKDLNQFGKNFGRFFK